MSRKPHTSIALTTPVVLFLAAAPTLAQVVTPPVTPPERAPAFNPQAPARTATAPRTAPRVTAPNVEFMPITEYDEDGKVVMLDVPSEYIALAHNPLIDLPAMVKLAPGLYERRQKVEKLVTDQIDLLLEIENGMIEEARVADEDSLRTSAGRLEVFTGNPTLSPTISGFLVTTGRLRPDLGMLTDKILQQHQQAVTADAMATATDDAGATPMDHMIHRLLRLSIEEYEFYFRRLMLDTADYFDAILPELNLDSTTSAEVAPLAAKLAAEDDLDARAALIREIFSHLDKDTRRRAMLMAIEMRPEIDATTLMAPVPTGATPVELDDETRRDLIFQLIEGGRVDTNAFTK